MATMPGKIQSIDTSAAGPNDREDSPRSTGRILIVDDHQPSLLALESILQPLGQTLVMANSGDEALRSILDHDFAVILMDVRMPDLDGLNAAQLIRERERSAKVPIIFLTAAPIETAEMFKAYDQGAVDFLPKPCDPHVLRSKVKVFVELFLKEEMIRRQAVLLMQRDREAFVRRGEARFRALLDSMPLCVLAIRPNGMVYYWNRTVAEYLGKPPGEAPESSPTEIVVPEDREQAARSWEDTLRDGQPVQMQFRMRRASDGIDRWHICRAVPELDDDGRITAWIWAATDINDYYEAREEAESANRAKDDFLATVSHELRNPLTAILGWARLLQSGVLDEARSTRAVDVIVNNAQNQATLIEDILDISRAAQGKLGVEFADVDLAQVVRAAVAAARPSADEKELDLIEQIEFDQECPVQGDANRLKQVLSNLLSNAIKFTAAGGHVTVRLRQDNAHAELSVADDGCGIEAQFLPLIFERFQQVDAGAARTRSGLGLGLAISRQLVALHKGAIVASSDGVGKGAVFTVRLPLRLPSHSDTETPQRQPGAGRSLSGIKVLLVDDDDDTRDMMLQLLTASGASTIPAPSARAALDVLQKEQPDVIVSDIGMPSEDGYTLIRKIRSLTPEQGGLIPACAVTGWNSASERQRAISAGFQLHVTKPAEPERLIAAIYSLAKSRAPAKG
ncbi:MAG TPA: response regulator [Candidatus Binataceae bacterium]|nr:response regulator [Candidatus Binataceae bacterium]